MRILYLNHNVIWKSAFHRCFQFAKRLVKKKCRVDLITNDPNSRREFNIKFIQGVKIVKSPDLFWGQLRTGWDPYNTLKRLLYLKNEKYDLIHAFDTRPTVIFPALYLKRKLNIPLVIDWGDWWGRGGAINLRKPFWLNKLFEPVEVFFEEFFKQYADHITVVSSDLLSRAKTLVGNKQIKISLIPNASDTDSIKPVNQKRARKLLGLVDQKYIVVFSGYVVYDIKLIIEALKILATQKFPLTLVVLGSEDKIFAKEGRSLIDSGRLILTGFVDYKLISLYLAASNVALLPLSNNIANKARYPMKFGDYLAAGKPIVTNNVGEVGKLVASRRLGVVCNYSANEYANAIKNLLSDNMAYQQKAKNCLSFAKGKHNYEARVKKLWQIYRLVLKNHIYQQH